ncbi:molecular chaperone DnaJ [Candidatus Uhrbacteria bacterium]|mgnify:CR=1 FL=1|jgi:molecular chaperone DnaJ|nr:molecular chaperone DnaJ [Candidatus Uhrbacteria bacterium]MBT7717221.1 molecular chaperone DnaJ [Candidatus Uhrbacteria bacterium]
MSKDYYNTLNVEKGASKDEVKKAFRKLAHEHHPDKGGDQEKFKEVNEAYQVLSDETKRSQYDQFGSSFDQAGGGGGGFGGFSGGGQGFGGQGVNFEDLGDMFSGMFGGGDRRTRQAQGSHIQVDMQLSFKEAVFGVEKEIQVSKNNGCERCGGLGAEPGSSMKTCTTCSGSGVQEKMQQTILGAIRSRVACESCTGQGETPEKKCSTCDGSGMEYGKKSLRVDVPAGVENGMKIRVRGQGESIGASGVAGDLYVVLYVKTDPRFERVGEHIFTNHKIGFTQAALGDEVEVETLEGKVKLKVPAGTQSGDKLRLRGKGVPKARGRGDMIVVMLVVTPKKVTRNQKKLLEDLDLNEK